MIKVVKRNINKEQTSSSIDKKTQQISQINTEINELSERYHNLKKNRIQSEKEQVLLITRLHTLKEEEKKLEHKNKIIKHSIEKYKKIRQKVDVDKEFIKKKLENKKIKTSKKNNKNSISTENTNNSAFSKSKNKKRKRFKSLVIKNNMDILNNNEMKLNNSVIVRNRLESPVQMHSLNNSKNCTKHIKNKYSIKGINNNSNLNDKKDYSIRKKLSFNTCSNDCKNQLNNQLNHLTFSYNKNYHDNNKKGFSYKYSFNSKINTKVSYGKTNSPNSKGLSYCKKSAKLKNINNISNINNKNNKNNINHINKNAYINNIQTDSNKKNFFCNYHCNNKNVNLNNNSVNLNYSNFSNTSNKGISFQSHLNSQIDNQLNNINNYNDDSRKLNNSFNLGNKIKIERRKKKNKGHISIYNYIKTQFKDFEINTVEKDVLFSNKKLKNNIENNLVNNTISKIIVNKRKNNKVCKVNKSLNFYEMDNYDGNNDNDDSNSKINVSSYLYSKVNDNNN